MADGAAGSSDATRPRCAAHGATRSSGWARSPRRSRRPSSCSAATTACSTSTTRSTAHLPSTRHRRRDRRAGCSPTCPACSASRSATSGRAARARRSTTMLADLDGGRGGAPAGRRHHYATWPSRCSGEVGRTAAWGAVGARCCRSAVLDPLEHDGVRRQRRQPPFAARVLRRPVRRPRAARRPQFPGHAFAPAAELWSTTGDLGRWASFCAEPAPRC